MLATQSKTLTVAGSHGWITADAETGRILRVQLNDFPFLSSEDSYARIIRIDVAEYQQKYGNLPDKLDILDVGYWTEDDGYEPPCQDWREDRDNMRKYGDLYG